MHRPRFVRGDLVEVKSAAEIAASLDPDGRLEGIPFMPEMAAHCGKRFRVHRRADRTCVEGLGMRRLGDTVFLEEVRCDGGAHDGCQRDCLMFWKEAWLKPASASEPQTAQVADNPDAVSILAASLPVKQGDKYVCQSTALAAATRPLGRWAPALLLQELRDGELSPSRLFAILSLSLLNKVRVTLGYPAVGALKGPARGGPKGDLKLAPGERVMVRSDAEISATLDPTGRNRGLTFEPDMAAFTGRTFEVAQPVERIIHEETGLMRQLTATVTLKGITCNGLCAKNCPRNNPVYWRESWLSRTEDNRAEPARPAETAHSGDAPAPAAGPVLAPTV